MWPRGAAIAAALLAATVASGCGSGEQQDANEPSGTYKVQLSRATFPRFQGLGETARFSVTVRNPGPDTIPNVAMTVDGFADPDAVPGAADPQRPIWVVNVGPYGGKTAYVNTWALGALKSREAKTFTWSVTSTVPGTHTVAFRAAAGLDGNARAVARGGSVPSGAITVRVTRRPRESTVDPKTGAVIYGAE